MNLQINDILNIKEIIISKSKSRILVAISNNNCWIPLHRALDKDGYARIHYKGIDTRLHKIMYLLYKGDIPKGYVIRHRCPHGPNRNCCNPEHLEIGTIQDNINDREVDGNTCRGERHPLAALSELKVEQILLDSKSTTSELARKYNVDRSTIRDIKQGKNWTHVFKRIFPNLQISSNQQEYRKAS